MSEVPRAVLSEALRDAMDGATLRAAVLTTFALEWAFTLDEVLPVFVPHSLSAAPNARREELAEHLLSHDAALTVYCDAGHAGDFERSSKVPLAVVPVDHPTGHFHPKVVLALIEKEGTERLVVAAGSANLTRASWWDWVECAHVTSIDAGERTWMRDGLLGFVDYLRARSVHPSDRRATDQVRAFLRRTRQAERASTSDAAGVVRFVWNGGRAGVELVDTVVDTVGSFYTGGRLEVVSPWFSEDGDKVLDRLVDRTQVAEVLAVVPEDPDGRAQLPSAAVDRLAERVTWASLPRDVVSSGPLPDAKPRHLHAKLYRFTSARRREQTLLIGSFNLTQAAFGAGANLEAGLLLDLPTRGKLPWLIPRLAPTAFAPERAEDEAENLPQSRMSPLRLTYDWWSRAGDAQWAGLGHRPGLRVMAGPVEVLALPDGWQPGPLPSEQGERLREYLVSSSPVFTVVTGEGEDLGFTVVTELGVVAKPSGDVDRRLSDAVADLLLDAEAGRARRGAGGRGRDDEGDVPDAERPGAPEGPSIFDGYAALYQGVAAFRDQVMALLAEGKTREVEHRLVGESSRCLGDLVTHAEKGAADDPAMSLVVCWAVEDVLASLRSRLRRNRMSVDVISGRVATLRDRLERRLAANNGADPEFVRFLQWARAEFVGGAKL